MNLEQLRARLAEIMAELRRIHGEAGPAVLSEEQQTRFDELMDQRESVQADIRRVEARMAVFGAGDGPGAVTVQGDGARSVSDGYDRDPVADPRDSAPQRGRGDPWDLSQIRSFGRPAEEVAGELKARALDAAARMPGVTDQQRAALVGMLEEQDNASGDLARHVLVASHPDYLRAFSKGLRGQLWNLTQDEKRAMVAASDLARAMSVTDSAGGYLIPQQLDPALILTSDGVSSPMREIATLKIATSDVWTGVSTTHASWSYDAEAAEVSDDATTFGQPSITLHTARGFIPVSIEGLAYEPNVTQVIGTVLANGKVDLEGASFVTGTGSGQPYGIVTAITGEATASATTDTFAVADVWAIQSALPAKYRSRARWLANNSIYALIRQFDTGGGANLWEYLGGGMPARLIGRPTHEAESMDGTITATSDNYVLIFGDFGYYYIVDRMGMVVESIPHLFHTSNNRPSGQRGFFAYCMHGADSVVDSAFEILNVT